MVLGAKAAVLATAIVVVTGAVVDQFATVVTCVRVVDATNAPAQPELTLPVMTEPTGRTTPGAGVQPVNVVAVRPVQVTVNVGRAGRTTVNCGIW